MGRIPAPERYVMYGNRLSYFSRKLEAALMFYGAPFDFLPKHPDVTEEIEARAATHQIPVLHTPENWMIADTTPLIDLLDARFPKQALIPEGPLGVLAHIVEEWFDEWTPRIAVHYRWQYEESADEAAAQMAEELAPEAPEAQKAIAAALRSWGPRSCRATGVTPEGQKKAAEAEYERVLAALQAQLEVTRFALGNRPTVVDCVLLGGLRAHFNADPVPKRVVDRYDRVGRWAGESTSWDGKGELAPFPESTGFARFVLGEMSGAYKSFALGNAAALAEGQKAFVVTVYGEEVSYLARAYPERSRNMIRDRIRNRLSAEDRTSVADWLREIDLLDCFGLRADSVPPPSR